MKLATLVFAFLFASFEGGAFAAPKGKAAHEMKMMNATPAQREDMAKAHEAMATCLRSTKPMMDCHKDMMASCKDKMGKSCPMMGHMGEHGMKHDHGMMEQEESDKK